MKRPSSLTDPRKSGKGCSDSSQNQRSEAQIFKYNNRCFKKFPQKDNWCNHGLFFELDESIMAITYRDTTKIVRFLFQSLELTFENPTKSSHMMSALLCLTCGTKNLGQCDPLSSIATGGSWRDFCLNRWAELAVGWTSKAEIDLLSGVLSAREKAPGKKWSFWKMCLFHWVIF